MKHNEKLSRVNFLILCFSFEFQKQKGQLDHCIGNCYKEEELLIINFMFPQFLRQEIQTRLTMLGDTQRS